MKSFSEIKKLSKEQLKNSWKLPILFSVITLALSFYGGLSNNASILLSIAMLVISFYFTRVIINLAEENPNASINVPFRHMLRTLGLGLLYSLFYFVINMVSIFAISFVLYSSTSSSILTLLIVISLVLLLIIVDIIAMCYLSMAIYLIYSKDYKTFESFKYSRLYLKGNIKNTLLLVVTFIPWILLGFITFGFGFIYVMPYLELAFTNYCIDLIDNYKAV
ncbi:MAG: DUF975 family protein [Peptostreptococcaceae bacterium]